MIARFKPTTRIASICATIVLLALACITFTTAAQKEKATAPKEVDAVPNGESSKPPVPTVAQDTSLKILEQELQRLDRDIEQREAVMEKLRAKLRMPGYIARGDGTQAGPEAEALRQLESFRMDVSSRHQALVNLYEPLAKMSRAELRKSAMTVTPDSQLGLLCDRLAESEQRLALLLENKAEHHPEVAAQRRLIARINQQIEERLDGVLAGLKAKADSEHAHAQQIEKQIAELKEFDLENSARYREYFKMKRELENLMHVRDRLHTRIIEERIDSLLPRTPNKRATDFDAAPKSP